MPANNKKEVSSHFDNTFLTRFDDSAHQLNEGRVLKNNRALSNLEGLEELREEEQRTELQLAEMRQQQQGKAKEWREKEESLKEAWEEFEKEKKQMRNFMTERQRAIKRIKERLEKERKTIEDKRKELNYMKTQVSKLEEEEEVSKKKLDSHIHHQHLLEKTVAISSGMFENLHQVVDRFETLVRTNQEMQQRMEQIDSEHSQYSESVISNHRYLDDESLVLNNKLNEARIRLEKTKKETEQKKNSSERSGSDIVTVTAQLAAIKQSIANLYSRVGKEGKCNDSSKALERIGDKMECWQQIVGRHGNSSNN